MQPTSRFITIVILVCNILVALPNRLSSQENAYQKEDLLSTANIVYGPDDRLINGKYYKPKHYLAEGHPYYLTNEWVSSNLFVKGIHYKNIPLKYNIEDDKLIIHAVFDNRVSKDILMHNSFVDSLYIGTHILHNTNNQIQENAIGIAELVYRGKNLIYFKHSIEFKDELSDRIKYGKYLKVKRKLYLFDGTTFFSVRTRKDILNYFYANEKEVNVYLRKNKIRLRKASTIQIVNLIHFCEQL